MFKNTFSFDGRIRRTEFGISFIIYVIGATIINMSIASSNGEMSILGFAYIPALWFLWAQGAKRCHDLGNNGWWQIIPFYILWLIFQDGEPGQNDYGENPKDVQQNTSNNSTTNQPIHQSSNPTDGYNPGHYDGGHNNNNTQGSTYNSNYNPSSSSTNSSGEYKSGEMYK